MKKRIILLLTAVSLSLFMVLFASSCQKKSYGEVFKTKGELTERLSNEKLTFKYPEYLGEDENAETQYIAVKDESSGEYTGYKIYRFGSPFYASVTAFPEESNKLLSDEESRTAFLKKIPSDFGDIDVYSGKGHKDALYLIGCINLDGRRYEIRVTADEEMLDGVYTHAIYEDNEYFDKSLSLITDIAESIK